MNQKLNACVANRISKGRKIKPGEKKKIYIKKIKTLAGFNVWLVNGKYIRESVCEDFIGFDQHYHLAFIPKNEFWIEKESSPGEEKYHIDHLLVENRMMASGKIYEKAYEKAAQVEKRERGKSILMRKIKKIKHKHEILEKIHKKILFKKNLLKIWLVNGELVRDLFFIDFEGGGHDLVYHFIPPGEIWIDDDIPARERKFIIIHEVHERNLMVKGKNYHQAHHSATEIEDFCRKHPSKTLGRIKKEISVKTRFK